MSIIWKSIISIIKHAYPIEPSKMAIIVRTDIYMGKGKTAAQCAHASLECYRKATAAHRGRQLMFQEWLCAGQPKIILKASSEKELLDLACSAKKVGLTTVIIRDAGRTQLEAGTISVIGIGPGPISKINNITSHLRLL